MLHSHTQWDNAFGTSSERVCKRAADCVFVCAVCMLIIPEHDVLGLNYSTQTHHSHWRNPNWGIQNKHTTRYTIPPLYKETSADCQGQCHWDSPADGPFSFRSWCEHLLVPWQTGCRLCSVCLLHLWSVTKIYLVVGL